MLAAKQPARVLAARPGPPRCTRMRSVKDVFMPALSSTMTEGKVVQWLKQEGDAVSKGEALVVVESDKADMDVESFEDGYLGSIVIEEGGTANVGAPIAYIAETEGEISDAKAKGGASSNGAAAAPAKEEEEPLQEETKAPTESEKVPDMAVATTGASVSAAPDAAKGAPQVAPVQQPPPPPSGPKPRADGRIIATPYAKQVAKKMKVDLSQVGGTGPNGRITASDVERHAGGGVGGNGATPPPASAPAAPAAMSSNGASASASPVPPPAAAPAAQAAAQAAGTTVAELRGTTTPFSGMEKAVANNMQSSLAVAEFRATIPICTDAMDKLYKELKPRGVTMSALIAKACGVALASHPRLFASCTADGAGITYNEHINVANAVAMDGGLITPVLKDADTTDIYTLSRTWKDLVKRARSKQLTSDEHSSGTFTVSNLGMMGVETFDAILPPGTGAILAVGASIPSVVANDDGMIGVKKMMRVNITCDHRIIYGAHAAEFLQDLKKVIESPAILLK